MEGSTAKAHRSEDCVRVAVNIRPLITSELLVGCTDCITVPQGEPQVQIGSHVFTYDHVYGNSTASSPTIYEDCVAPLIDSLFHGYNATVLAYGQTGSGKTYTMGTNYAGEGNNCGIIPRVMDDIFRKVDIMKANIEFLIRVSFIEIFKEEVFDLLDPCMYSGRCEGAHSTKVAPPTRVPIQIRETATGGITLAGVTEADVRSKEEMASFLARGSQSRATGSTNMNSQSSRSHAIFTISIEQKRNSSEAPIDDTRDDILCAKLHLVDLAGSERAKRTGADGLRLKEGIHINRGLLALGNVISALGDERKRKEGGHVPYRDSKLTRLLQDSLGGNSKTVMIACVSPADTNAEETINTLKYANRARNIQNKAVVNRDPVAAQMQKMRNQLEQLQAELLHFRGGGSSLEEFQVLEHRISLLEARNTELLEELNVCQLTCSHLKKQALEAQVEKDKLMLKLEYIQKGSSLEENVDKDQGVDLLKGYLSKIQGLEAELLRLQSLPDSKRGGTIHCLDVNVEGLDFSVIIPSSFNNSSSGGTEVDEKECEHSSLQDQLGMELLQLDKQLEQKEAEMKLFSKVDNSALKQHFEKKVLELEEEKKVLQKEIDDLRHRLANLSSTSDDGAQKLKEEYLKKLNLLESQVSDLKKKQDAQSQLLRQKQKGDEAAKRLQDEIQRIKAQKVQLQQKIKQESEQFRSWKASREKEVLQLKKEGRRNEYEMHKLLALNQKQKMVLQRKAEEASVATKRLKELLEAKKSTREISGIGNMNGSGFKALMQAMEHELEVAVRVHEVRSEYDRQLQARAAMANELSKLKEEYENFRKNNFGACSSTMSPSARNSRISALENMLETSSSTLVSMASQLSEAEERERAFISRGRWIQIRSLPEAKNVMNYLFNLASSSRCHTRDKELACSEKDVVIKELKEKVVNLSSLVKHLEAQKLALYRQSMVYGSRKYGKEVTGSFGSLIGLEEDGCSYDLRKAPRRSQFFGSSNSVDLLEDMITSESELSEPTNSDDEEWVESRKKIQKKRSRTTYAGRSSSEEAHDSEKSKLEFFYEEPSREDLKTDKHTCCTCSKSSSCKTKKCECRAANGSCGASCGCNSSKCANRGETTIKEKLVTEQFETVEQCASEKTLISNGASLLHSALTANIPAASEGIQQRKPLLDIGNKASNMNVPAPRKRKNWRRSVIQLVPATPPVPAQPENDDHLPRTRSDDVLNLPKAMLPPPSNSPAPLGERNNINTDEPTGTGRKPAAPDGKENA